ncbi:(2Fe-2S)-binding protein [Georgenia ruanii]|uniref:(2Fe-2S)-binding protein n=1 Tax=Georgenia ruanii TaxID=348442 RepID=A0A7J9UWW5_9MICO|nr:(2Fe-2S)-binding protein [Georgenia ruanii]MPV89119.1 (2Fe-2S)-binding protein [Georgenia ruanii]
MSQQTTADLLTGPDLHAITVTVDGETRTGVVPSRKLLVHWLRDDLDRRGPKIGCDTGNCGACTVRWDGKLAKSCMILAVQADGSEVETAASLAAEDGTLNDLQQKFKEHHALQCGYCTSGFLMTATDFLESGEEVTNESVRRALKGNICRCTGYENIVNAVCAAGGADAPLPHGRHTEAEEARA